MCHAARQPACPRVKILPVGYNARFLIHQSTGFCNPQYGRDEHGFSGKQTRIDYRLDQ